ncbi:MAG: hypothetical protein P8I91_06040 [Phycisphaerales bacterium]|nr:hypothetical protein [Phycisphaerales bacterium]
MRIAYLPAVALTAITSIASADIALDITWSTGSGDNTAYAVIDFSATADPVYAFSYSWDDTATVHDMLLALNADGLGYDWTDWGSGIFINNFSYGNPVGNPDYYWAHSLGTVTDDGPNWTDAMLGVDMIELSDGFISGWYNGFNDDYSAIPPTLPLVAVPAPGGIAAMLLALALHRRRRC